MNWDALGAIVDLVGALAVVVTLVYLATQIRQSNAQQKREEIVSVQTGQNKLAAQLQEPALARAYAMTADGDIPASVADRARAILWVVQCLNHFEIDFDLYHNGSLDEERYNHWESIFVSLVASKGIRAWWEDGFGRRDFESKVRNLIDRKLNDTDNPPKPFDEIWEFLNSESWRSEELSDVAPGT